MNQFENEYDDLKKNIKKSITLNKQLQNKIRKIETDQQLKQKHLRKCEQILSSCEFERVAMKIAYLGGNYQGFSQQINTSNTVEEYLFKALKQTILIKDIESAEYQKSGRTDKGVSALGNVISLNVRKIDSSNTHENLQWIINRNLPAEIKIMAYTKTTQQFNARFHCKARVYKYFFPENNMNIQLMQEGSQYYKGKHDFRNFCKVVLTNTVEFQEIFQFDIEKSHYDPIGQHDNRLTMYCATIKGSSFLYHQVRCMMEILFCIGKGLEQPSLILQLLDIDTNQKKPTYGLASDQSLMLYDCLYDDIKFQSDDQNLINLYDNFKNIICKQQIELILYHTIWRYVSNQWHLPNNQNEIFNEFSQQNNEILDESHNLEKKNLIIKKQGYTKIMQMATNYSIEEKKNNLKPKQLEVYNKKMIKKIQYEQSLL